jgi:nicotinate-nucleotide adenylyltransferase
MTKAIGILGGTFDPIHYGHLRPALEVADKLALSHIRLIPNAIPPHRPQPLATAEQRLIMLQLAVENNQQFKVDDRELTRDGISYTFDTLASLRQEYPTTALYLLLGSDAFLYIQTWHRWQELLDLAHIAVMQRPGELPEMNQDTRIWYQQYLASSEDINLLHGKIWPVSVTQLMISATAIRSMVAHDQSTQFLLPDAVACFVKQNKMYSAE